MVWTARAYRKAQGQLPARVRALHADPGRVNGDPLDLLFPQAMAGKAASPPKPEPLHTRWQRLLRALVHTR